MDMLRRLISCRIIIIIIITHDSVHIHLLPYVDTDWIKLILTEFNCLYGVAGIVPRPRKCYGNLALARASDISSLHQPIALYCIVILNVDISSS